MDPSRTALNAKRAAQALKEASVAAGGAGTEVDPVIGIMLADTDKPAAFYRVDTVPDDLLAACKTIIYTDAVQAFIVADTYVEQPVEGLPSLTDDPTVKGRDDLPRLFRARDPRAFEAMRIDWMTRDRATGSATLPYRYRDGAIEWLEDHPSYDPGDNLRSLTEVLGKMWGAAFTLADERPETVAPIGALEVGFIVGLDTLVPDGDGGYTLLPFAQERARKREEHDGVSHAHLRLPGGGDLDMVAIKL